MDALLHRHPPTSWELLFRDPIRTLAKSLYHARPRGQQSLTDASAPIVAVCVSDTHSKLPQVPPGDLLIHAGDLSQSGTRNEVQAILDWIAEQPHRHKVVIAGNHELLLDPTKIPSNDERESLEWHDIRYLQDSAVTLRFPGDRALKVYGSPWSGQHGSWAFQYPKGTDRWTKTVPDDTDVLITHMPPSAHLDIDGWGDRYLLSEVKRVRPLLHVYGHFHAGYGIDGLVGDEFEAAYESIMMRQYSFMTLLAMLLHWLSCYCLGRSRIITVLINAAIVGGARDEETRQALVVTI